MTPVSRCQAAFADLLVFLHQKLPFLWNDGYYLGPQYLRLHKLHPCPLPDPPANASEL